MMILLGSARVFPIHCMQYEFSNVRNKIALPVLCIYCGMRSLAPCNGTYSSAKKKFCKNNSSENSAAAAVRDAAVQTFLHTSTQSDSLPRSTPSLFQTCSFSTVFPVLGSIVTMFPSTEFFAISISLASTVWMMPPARATAFCWAGYGYYLATLMSQIYLGHFLRRTRKPLGIHSFHNMRVDNVFLKSRFTK